ncbi:hypothetical protein HA052_26785 [Chromobacterium haemolyticum]|uniref:Uncharacterized protein n=1 Tax=Chromobacterium fluminis TaxID=3044269 RepID=A0ABX0LCI1_9NEIS|nr:hypothetical protein [Chromobacterium haemolyticum]NHR08798.1 hypothetical protein [Chromobacterium haemolyticum]
MSHPIGIIILILEKKDALYWKALKASPGAPCSAVSMLPPSYRFSQNEKKDGYYQSPV